MGYDMQEGTLVRWLKGVGDEVQLGEAIAEIETDKAVIEFESTTAGIVKKIIVDEGSIVPVGDPVIVIGSQGEEIQENSINNSGTSAETEKTDSTEEISLPKPDVREKIKSNNKKISPAARRLANENNIDLSSISGSGPGGRITRDDVTLLISSENDQKSHMSSESIPQDSKQNKVRQQIARVTTKSKREIPHFYLTNEIDMTVAMNLSSKLTPDGLIVPAILGCEKKSLEEIAISSKDLIDRSNSGTLSSKEYTDGTFSISNLGMYNISSFGAIILPPQTCMLATGAVSKKPIVSSNEIVIADIMTTTLSGDHRVANGAEGAKFLETFKNILENPTFINI